MMSNMLYPIVAIVTGKGDPNQAGVIEHDEAGNITTSKTVGLRKAQQLLFQHAAAGDYIETTLNDDDSRLPFTTIRIFDRRDFEATKARYEVSVERRKES